MEHLKMEGAPAGTPGNDGLTINDLPDDIITNIFSMMDFESLLVVVKVCMRWQQLCKTPYIWKYACFKVDYFNYEEVVENILPIVGNYLTKIKIDCVYNQLRASLIRYCPNLTHLELKKCSILDDLHHWPNLKFLSFHVIPEIKPDFDYKLSFVANNLKTLKIDGSECSLREAKLLVYLIRSCPNLTRLEICNSVVDSSIFDELHLLPNLKFLSFNYSEIHGANSNSAYNLPFKKFKYLETLILSKFSLTRDSLYSMIECENLVSIDIKYVTNIPADFLESLVRTKQSTLRALSVYGVTFNDGWKTPELFRIIPENFLEYFDYSEVFK